MEKIILQPREKVQFLSSSGDHFTYYDPSSQRVKYHCLGKEKGIVPDVFQKSCTGLCDLDVFADGNSVYIAMACYSISDNDHTIEMVVLSSDTERISPYPFPPTVSHATFIRKCAFIIYHGHLSVISWSIDGTRIIHRLYSDKWNVQKYPFQVYHVMVSENTIGLLDNNFYFHVFHPDGGYRNMTLHNDHDVTMPVSACHFSVSAKQLMIGFPDGSLFMHFINCQLSRKFSEPIRNVYGDADMWMVFLDNGDVSFGEIKDSLPEVTRWRRVFHGGEMRRYVYRRPYLMMDGDVDGLVLRRWMPSPSETGLMARIHQATMAREQVESGLSDGMGFGQFLQRHRGNETLVEEEDDDDDE